MAHLINTTGVASVVVNGKTISPDRNGAWHAEAGLVEHLRPHGLVPAAEVRPESGLDQDKD